MLRQISLLPARRVGAAKRQGLELFCDNGFPPWCTYERGGDINIAKRMAGHSNVKTTELYDPRR
ncbi:MAG TPA: hypothetical protein VJX28_03760 [Chthoniobacterales bacterium]|nr:hypothetical protein [Chthoniobacterales bacterium]